MIIRCQATVYPFALALSSHRSLCVAPNNVTHISTATAGAATATAAPTAAATAAAADGDERVTDARDGDARDGDQTLTL